MPRHRTRTSFVIGDIRLVGRRLPEDSLCNMREKLKKRLPVPCDYCGMLLYVIPYKVQHQKWHFCDGSCYRAWQSKAAGVLYRSPGFPADVHRLGAIASWQKKSEKEKIDWTRKMGSANRCRPTKPELIVMNLIKKFSLPYKYTGDGRFWIEKINPDFVNCNGKKVIIEVFGDYWHNQEKVKERDERHLQVLRSFGWERIIVWECELKSGNEEKIVNRIMEVS